MNHRKWKRLVVLFLLGMVVANAWILWYGRDFIFEGYGDFTAFYAAGKLVARGQASKIYDPAAEWSVQQEFAPQVKIRRGALPYVHPPFESLLFFFLAYLGYPAACLVWMGIKLLILFAVPFLLKPYLPDPPLIPALLQGLLALSFVPVVVDLLHGQDDILLLLIFALLFVALKEHADLRAGLLLSLGLFKFHLVLPLALIFGLRGKARVALGFILGGLGLTLVSAWLVGWTGLLAYGSYLSELSHSSSPGVMAPETMPNLRGLLTLFAKRAPSLVHANWLYELIAMLGVGFTANFWRKGDEGDSRLFNAGFSLSIVVVLLTSYYAHSYDMTLLILPILLLGETFLRAPELSRWPRRIFAASVAVLLFSPLYWALIFHLHQLFWMAFVLFPLAGAITVAMRQWRAARLCPQ